MFHLNLFINIYLFKFNTNRFSDNYKGLSNSQNSIERLDLLLKPQLLQNILENGNNKSKSYCTLSNEKFHQLINEKIGRCIKKCNFMYYKILFQITYFLRNIINKYEMFDKYIITQEIYQKKILHNYLDGGSYFGLKGKNKCFIRLKWYLNEFKQIAKKQSDNYPRIIPSKLMKRKNRKKITEIFNICELICDNSNNISLHQMNKLYQILAATNKKFNAKELLKIIETSDKFGLSQIDQKMYKILTNGNEYCTFLKHRSLQ